MDWWLLRSNVVNYVMNDLATQDGKIIRTPNHWDENYDLYRDKAEIYINSLNNMELIELLTTVIAEMNIDRV